MSFTIEDYFAVICLVSGIICLTLTNTPIEKGFVLGVFTSLFLTLSLDRILGYPNSAYVR